jgi:hypothetical protein
MVRLKLHSLLPHGLSLELFTLKDKAEYPIKPIHLIVGFSPGGSADTVGRALAEGLSARSGNQLLLKTKRVLTGILQRNTLHVQRLTAMSCISLRLGTQSMPRFIKICPMIQ